MWWAVQILAHLWPLLFAKTAIYNLTISNFFSFRSSKCLKIQIWPDSPTIMWGCQNFLILQTFWSGHSFCLKNSFYSFKNPLFSVQLCQNIKTLSNEQNFVNPFEQSLFFFCCCCSSSNNNNNHTLPRGGGFPPLLKVEPRIPPLQKILWSLLPTRKFICLFFSIVQKFQQFCLKTRDFSPFWESKSIFPLLTRTD